MAFAIASGVVDDSDITQNERVIDMEDVIDQLEGDVTQFTTALMKVASKPATSSKVEWLEDRLFPRVSALAASATSGATTLTVTTDTGVYFRVGDVVRNSVTGEAYSVTSISTDTLTVVRSIGSVAAASSVSAAELVIIGNAAAQGASLGTEKITKTVPQYNYTQIFRHPFTFTNTLAASNLYGGNEPDRETRKKGIEHKRALETSLFYGARDLNTGGSEPIGYMGGISEFVTTNVHDPSGAMANTEFETFLTTDLQYGSQDKVIFASPQVSKILSTYMRDNWVRSTPDQNRYGVKVDAFVSGAFGYELPIITKREWGEFNSSYYGSRAFVVDMSAVKYRPLRTTKLLLNRQAPGDDKVSAEWLTETAFELANETKHGIILNATS